MGFVARDKIPSKGNVADVEAGFYRVCFADSAGHSTGSIAGGDPDWGWGCFGAFFGQCLKEGFT